MPELPEAETIVRGLRPHLPGRTLRSVEVLHDDLIPGGAQGLSDLARGMRFLGVDRRGKNIVVALGAPSSSGGSASAAASAPVSPAPEPDPLSGAGPPPSAFLVVNLGMSGRLLFRAPGDPSPPPTHPGVRFHLEGGGVLVYHDVRRFGRLELRSPEGLRAWSRSLGPEPLGTSFTARRLTRDLAASVSPVRSWLLDQRRVAGVGNIYANEALFLAGIHPRTRAADIPETGARRLHRAVRRVLREAIRARGTTLRDYRTAAGDEGGYAGTLRVYGREGSPCPRCGAPVERLVFGNRSAFRCPRCQPEVTT
jgi:formamidopyrimidine-DNA glycosylase